MSLKKMCHQIIFVADLKCVFFKKKSQKITLNDDTARWDRPS